MAVVADVFSTWVALTFFYMEEANPLAAYLFERVGFWPASAVLLLPWTVVLAAVRQKADGLAPLALRHAAALMICIRLVVAAQNAALIAGAA